MKRKTMNEELQNSTARRPNRRREPMKNDRFLKLRQWLNAIFMLGASVGVIIYLSPETRTVGTIIILVAIVFKLAEAALRIIR